MDTVRKLVAEAIGTFFLCFAGIAAISANLPTDDNSICQKAGRAVPVAIINGTADPINPYGGGRVTLFGFGDRGTVVSSAESAAQFARLPRLHFALHDTARHFIMWDDPMWFFREVDAFLADPVATTAARGFDVK